MRPLVLSQTLAEVAFWGTFGVWVVFERILWFRDIRLKAWNLRQDRGSYLWVIASVIAGLGASLLVAERDVVTLPAPWAWLVLGLVVAWAGLALRAWAVFTLGRSFTTVVQVRPEQTVVANGPYRFVRHPSYLGMLVLFLGLGTALGDLTSIVVMVVLPALGLAKRIQVEEAALRAGLGESYAEYCKGRARLVPGVW